jgi:hypothetical protein
MFPPGQASDTTDPELGVMIQKGENANHLPQGDPYFDAVTRFVERFFRWITQLCWRDPNSLLVATYEDSHGRRGSRSKGLIPPVPRGINGQSLHSINEATQEFS